MLLVLTIQKSEAQLKKKHVAISFHAVREAVAARIVAPFWIESHENYADICTKQLPHVPFKDHVCDLMA